MLISARTSPLSLQGGARSRGLGRGNHGRASPPKPPASPKVTQLNPPFGNQGQTADNAERYSPYAAFPRNRPGSCHGSLPESPMSVLRLGKAYETWRGELPGWPRPPERG